MKGPLDHLRVATAHSFTARMCAATRWKETLRGRSSLFHDPLAQALAGEEGMAAPMGDWILVPRTRYGDDFLVEQYFSRRPPGYPCVRQLVLLGAGMDARAYRRFAPTPTSPGNDDGGNATNSEAARLIALSDLAVFEIDQPTTFDVKEAILKETNWPLTVKSRRIVPFDFAKAEQHDGGLLSSSSWGDRLIQEGFDPNLPSVWLLEGLLYYLPDSVVAEVMREIGRLSSPGSAVFHDSVSAQYVNAGVAPGGAPFVSGSDDYAALWREYGHFPKTKVVDFQKSLRVNRSTRCLERHGIATRNTNSTGNLSYCPAPPETCKDQYKVLFVESFKPLL